MIVGYYEGLGEQEKDDSLWFANVIYVYIHYSFSHQIPKLTNSPLKVSPTTVSYYIICTYSQYYSIYTQCD